jgi:hypothetical protein
MTAAVLALIVTGAAAAIAALREPPPPRHRLDGELVQERWDRRRTDRWT